MFGESVRAIVERELRALSREIQAYPDDEAPWRTPPGAPNSAGTLALHLAGNLRHYVGALLGGSSYRRDRAAEFARRGIARAELVAEIDRAIAEVRVALATLDEGRLGAAFPEPVGGVTVETGDFLIHLVAHLAYHLGQVDYHRRLSLGDGATVGVVRPAELSSAKPSAG